MAEIIHFKPRRPQDKYKGKTLCKSGFHKWEVVKGNPFDVKTGKLITRYQCTRCGATKVEKK